MVEPKSHEETEAVEQLGLSYYPECENDNKIISFLGAFSNGSEELYYMSDDSRVTFEPNYKRWGLEDICIGLYDQPMYRRYWSDISCASTYACPICEYKQWPVLKVFHIFILIPIHLY